MKILFISLLFFSTSVIAQVPGNLNEAVLQVAFPEKTGSCNSKKSILLPVKNSVLSRFNPFIYLGAGGLYVYQNFISEQIKARCNYKLSCSEFTKRSIAKKGFFSGLLSGIDQLGNCSESVVKDFPGWMIDDHMVIDNRHYLEN